MKKVEKVWAELSAKSDLGQVELATDPRMVADKILKRVEFFEKKVLNGTDDARKALMQIINSVEPRNLSTDLSRSQSRFEGFESQIKDLGVDPRDVKGYKEWAEAVL